MTSQFKCLDEGNPMIVSRQDFKRVIASDEYSDISWLNEIEDGKRLQAYYQGDWHMIGVQAKAYFLIPLDGHHVVQTLSSPGLWGIESDSDEDYLDDVYAAECAQLSSMLATLGVRVTA